MEDGERWGGVGCRGGGGWRCRGGVGVRNGGVGESAGVVWGGCAMVVRWRWGKPNALAPNGCGKGQETQCSLVSWLPCHPPVVIDSPSKASLIYYAVRYDQFFYSPSVSYYCTILSNNNDINSTHRIHSIPHHGLQHSGVGVGVLGSGGVGVGDVLKL